MAGTAPFVIEQSPQELEGKRHAAQNCFLSTNQKQGAVSSNTSVQSSPTVMFPAATLIQFLVSLPGKIYSRGWVMLCSRFQHPHYAWIATPLLVTSTLLGRQ